MPAKSGRERTTSWPAQTVWAVTGVVLALIVYELLDIRGDEERTALLLRSSRAGDLAEVREALGEGADPGAATPAGWTALHLAAKGGHAEVAEVLIQAGASVAVAHPEGWTPLHRAAEVGAIGSARSLLAAGAPVDARGNGRTALGVALALGQIEFAGYLIDQGATLGVVDARSGLTPSLYAAGRGDPLLLSKVLGKGGSVADRFPSGKGLLHLAVASGDREVLRLLLSRGANPNQPDAAGETPLHVAARRGDVELAGALVAAGADRGARNRAGEQPVDLAPGPAALVGLLAPSVE